MKYSFLPDSIKSKAEIISHDEFVTRLKAFIELKYRTSESKTHSGGKANAAWIWGVSKAMVTYVTTKKKKPTQKMLDDIGYDEHVVTLYVKRRNNHEKKGTKD